MAIAALAIASCGALSLSRSPALFGGSAAVDTVDFDRDRLHRPPDGFEPRAGQWSVEDSPTASSGEQVLVERSDTAASLAVKKTEHARAVGGEVAVRVFLGDSGAGLACLGAGGDSSYVLKLEPGKERLVLYRGLGASMTVVSSASASGTKGEWRRLGLRCEAHRVTGYLDGKPVVRGRAELGAMELALYGDPGVTAQFDDLKYWSRK